MYIPTVGRILTDYFRSPYSHLLHGGGLEFVAGSRFSIIRFYILYEPNPRHVVVLIVVVYHIAPVSFHPLTLHHHLPPPLHISKKIRFPPSPNKLK